MKGVYLKSNKITKMYQKLNEIFNTGRLGSLKTVVNVHVACVVLNELQNVGYSLTFAKEVADWYKANGFKVMEDGVNYRISI